MSFWKKTRTIVPQVDLFSFVFWKNWRYQKEISKLTDLYREFDKSQLSFKMLYVFVVLQKWSTPPKPPAPAPAPVFSGLLHIVAPVVAGLLVLGIGCLMCLVIMVRKKRSLHGTYNPRKHELCRICYKPLLPRCDCTEMNVFKKPIEERLIWAISVSVTKINSPCQIHSAKLTKTRQNTADVIMSAASWRKNSASAAWLTF